MAETIDAPLIGFIEYFPVYKGTVAGKTYAAGTDSAQWKRNLLCFFPFVYEITQVFSLLVLPYFFLIKSILHVPASDIRAFPR
jgi:hypothetical protein